MYGGIHLFTGSTRVEPQPGHKRLPIHNPFHDQAHEQTGHQSKEKLQHLCNHSIIRGDTSRHGYPANPQTDRLTVNPIIPDYSVASYRDFFPFTEARSRRAKWLGGRLVMSERMPWIRHPPLQPEQGHTAEQRTDQEKPGIAETGNPAAD